MAGSGEDRRARRAAPRRRTVRGKLVLLVISSVGIAVALVAGMSAWREGERDAALQTERLGSTATVMASLSADATAVGDRARAFKVLRSIAQMPGVFYGRIDRADGSLLVETGGGARLISDVALNADGPNTAKPGLLEILQSRTSQVSSPVMFEGRRVGRVVLMGRTEGVLGRFFASLSASLLAAVAAVTLGLLVAWRLQRGITRPIVALTRSMNEVQKDHDYGRSVDIVADDEIADLVEGFNRMLGDIRERDGRIAAQVSGLETEVASRTADLRVAKESAEAANSAKSDFLATMSHEIRTPMNGIMVMAEILAAGEMPPRQRRFAEVIAKSGSSLLAIINDILDFSKIEAGKMELESAPVDLSDIVEDVCSLFWERAASKGLDLASYVDPGTPQFIAADAVRLRQVIGNLTNNAIKFTETGGVLIEVEPDTPTSIRISVRDTGVGIPKDKIGGVFGAFTQADQSTTRKFGGTGLGLAICKRLVDAMGGRFIVKSDVGRGSTFAFCLPVDVIEPARAWVAAPLKCGVALVANPGVSTRRALGRYLARAGFSVGYFDAGATASGACVVLGDPVSLKTLGAVSAPVICMAAYGDSGPQEMQRTGAAQAILVQPFRRRDLEALLRQLENGRPLQDAQTDATAVEGETLPCFANARVLVADDSAVNREVAQEALSRLGVTPKLVNDGRMAVDATKAQPFDLILMDGSMPELDGYDAAREIRRLEQSGQRRTVIVALTAHVVGSAAEAWREAGMDAVLHKPFTLASLAKTLGAFLEPSAALAPAPMASAPEPKTASPATVASKPVAAVGLIDPDVAAQLAEMARGGRADFVIKINNLYRENAPDCIARVAHAIEAHDVQDAAKAAHALKSMSYNIGACGVSMVAGEIEAAAREGIAPSPQDLERLKGVLTRTLALIAGEAAAIATPSSLAPIAEGTPAPAMTAETRELLADLDLALTRDELSLVYQPQVDREGERFVCVETLLRWVHPTKGPISPALFIPIAEEHGLIGRITSWVVERLLAETRYLSGVQVAFNASALEFADPGFVDRLTTLIERHGYDPRRLEVEITETAILQNEGQVRENMNRLHAIGMQIALDDFGAGYSSLGHLRRYPFDKLKIDREFITDCSRDMQAATVVHAVVSIGRALGMKVIAEGVETETQRKFLKVAGVHAMQGYLFGKAVGIDELPQIIKPRAKAQA